MGGTVQQEDQDKVSRQTIFETIASEAAGLYGLLITVSTGVFGATLVFLDKIAPSPTRWSIVFLGLGWFMLILCMFLCAWVRWNNIESGRLVLEKKFEKARKLDSPNRMLTRSAILALFFGALLLGAFGLTNIVHKVSCQKGNLKMCENSEKSQQEHVKEETVEKAIPFASTQPPAGEQQGESDGGTNPETEEPKSPHGDEGAK